MRNDMIERPAGRYGPQRLSRSNRRWIAVGLGVLVLAAGIGIAVMAAQRLGTGEVKGELTTAAYRHWQAYRRDGRISADVIDTPN